jgi:hypothetical protein
MLLVLCGGAFSVAAQTSGREAPSSDNQQARITADAALDLAAAGRPVATAGRNLSTLVGMPSIIDGSQSLDPSGQLIRFRWSVVDAPAGSAATLDAHDPAPVFVPDVAGTYKLQLVVTNEEGLESRPTHTTLHAFASRPAPNARAGKARQVRLGNAIDLDARQSYDAMQTPLTFYWSLLSAPRESKLTSNDIFLRHTPQAWFTPDVVGGYVLRLEASNGELTSEDRVTITAKGRKLGPIAAAGDHRYAPQRGPFTLDGTASFDPDRSAESLGFAWRLVSRPADSMLTSSAIHDADAAIATVMPDVDGPYVFRLTVNDGEQSDGDNVLVRLQAGDTSDADEGAQAGGTTRSALSSDASERKPDDKSSRFDFALSARPSELRINAGGEGAVDVKLRMRGLGSPVARLGVSGVPQGVTATFADRTLERQQTTTLTLKVDANAPAGSYPLLIRATASIRGHVVTRSASVSLVITRLLGGPEVQTTCGSASVAGLNNVIYVALNGTNNATCGTAAVSACATIQQGIDRCSGAGCAVLVHYGRYPATLTITLKDGVSVYGGCHFPADGAVDAVAANYRTLIDAKPASGTPAISGESINTPTVVSGLAVLSAPATGLSSPAIVMVANKSKGLTLSNSSLIAGTGIDGGPLQPGATSPGGSGGPGGSLGPAYAFPAGSCPTPGEIPPPMSIAPIASGASGGPGCAANPSGNVGFGGQGADLAVNKDADCRGSLYCTCNDDIAASKGRDGQASGSVGGGGGGAHGPVGCGCERSSNGVPPGGTGNPGATGACADQGGPPSAGFGAFRGTSWIPVRGGQGAPGSTGSGGGGGGAGGMAAWTNISNEILYHGLAGGGGGGGGCAGPGGLGGDQGGASIALVLVDSSMPGVANSNSIVPGPGGTGGSGSTGGMGGQGGAGGTGQQGGSCSMYKDTVCGGDVPGSGGTGGQGGQGGAGGGGASGSGGPSIGIALVAGSPDPGSAGVYAGLPGRAGSTPGSGGRNAPSSIDPSPCTAAGGRTGVNGVTAPVLNFDAISPANLLLPGEKLMPGQSLTSPNGRSVLAMQADDGNLCLYAPRPTAVWCSHTNGIEGLYLIMQPDGNLEIHEIYNNDSKVYYESGTHGHPGSYVAVRDNGTLVIYDGLTPIWTQP